MGIRPIHVAPEGDGFAAHMPGHPFVGAGNTEADAIQEVLDNVPNLLVQNVEIVRVQGPLFQASGAEDASQTIEIRRNRSQKIVANLMPNVCVVTGPSELDALGELFTISPQILRRGRRLDIKLFGRQTGEKYQVVMYLNEYRDYTATLEPDLAASEGGSPLEALMNLLTTVPHVFRFGSKIIIRILRDAPVTREKDMQWGL